MGELRRPIPAPLSASIENYPGIKGRNPLQAEFKQLADLVVEDLPESDEREDDFLEQCYCESGALSQHSLASKALLRKRHEFVFDSKSQDHPAAVPAVKRGTIDPELYSAAVTRRPVLLVGTVGVGKSIFIRKFMRVDAKDLIERSLALHIDLGHRAALSSSLRSYVIDAISQELVDRYGIDIEEDNRVRAVYRSELQRLEKSIYGRLKQSDPQEYERREIEKLAELIDDKAEHCLRSLQHFGKNEHRQVIVFIDNADQRDDSTQDEAFLLTRASGTRH